MDVVGLKDNNTRVSVQGILFNNLKFAGNINLLEECRDKLQDNLRMVDEAGKAFVCLLLNGTSALFRQLLPRIVEVEHMRQFKNDLY